MNDFDPSLDRLLRTAAQYRPASKEEPPFGFSTRVVAAWRGGAGLDRAAALQTVWFRRAFLCALAVMAVSVGWSFKTDTAVPGDDLAVAGYDASADLP
jgi:hypothetical protein